MLRKYIDNCTQIVLALIMHSKVRLKIGIKIECYNSN